MCIGSVMYSLDWVQILALPFISYMTLRKVIFFMIPSFVNEDKNNL